MIATDQPVHRLDRIDLQVGAPIVADAATQAAIEAHFAAVHAANPSLWNGAFFLFEETRFEGGAFTAQARPTDYATFLHWRSQGFPGETRTHVFPVPAVTTADRRLLVGVMGRATSNPGLSYPPSGSFDPSDLIAGPRLDPVANMVRELAEEAGLDATAFAADPGFVAIGSGRRRIALVRRWRTEATAAELGAAIAAHLDAERDPELGGFDFPTFDRRFAPDATVPYVNTLLALLAAEG